MIELLLIIGLLVFSGALFLGASIFFTVVLLIFKMFLFGLRLLFSLGLGAVFAAVVILFVIFKLSVLLFSVAMVALPVLFVLWVLSKMFGGARCAVPSYAGEPYHAGRGASVREETILRLRRNLDRYERRMADLEAELSRRGR